LPNLSFCIIGKWQKRQKITVLEEIMGEGKVSQTILVVGGGISGLTSALEAAEAGHEVIIVEKKSLSGR